MKKNLLTILFSIFLAAAVTLPASGALAPAPGGVGIPIGPHGFPEYYMDATGLRLEPCLPPPAGYATLGESMCIYDPLDPSSDLVVAGELFWWMGETSMAMPGGGDALLTLAIEGTFGGNEDPVDGQQISFARVRIRVDTPVAGTYTVTHPYGENTFVIGPDDVADGINYTADIGAANFLTPEIGFRGTLTGPIGPFLVWPGYATNTDLQLREIDPVTGEPTGVVLEQYVGNPSIPHVVTGSPTGNNFFRVQGPSIDIMTDEFSIMGKVYDPNAARTAHVFPDPPDPKLFAVGPVNRVNHFSIPSVGAVTGTDFNYSVGYPIWYQENIGTVDAPSGGLQLTLCPPGDPMCISDPIDPNDLAMTTLRTGGEGFWWSAGARILDLPGTDRNRGRAELVLGLEATFGGDESMIDGQQIAFGRVRIRVDTPAAGTYIVTHPYGEITFQNVPAGDKGINYTADIGIIDPADPDWAFIGALYSDIGPTFLKWTTFNADPLLTDPLLIKIDPNDPNLVSYHVGDPGLERQVTGSPFGTDYFRVRGPNGFDVQTNLFSVSGKIFDPATFEFPVPDPLAPVALPDSAVLDLTQASSITIGVLANDTFANPVTVTLLPAGAAFGPDGGTVALNGNGTVTYTPAAGFTGTDTFAYQITDASGLTSNTAVVTVTVATISVGRARLDLRRLAWDIRGQSGFEGATLTLHAGPTAAGPVIGTALVANGRWRLRATTTTNPNVGSISITSSNGSALLNQPLQIR
jgi:hypothetical protein